MSRTTSAKRPPPLLNPEIATPCSTLAIVSFSRAWVGGGRDRFDETRWQWAGLTVDEAIKELRRSGPA
jgi:hypothetical protein